MRRYFVFVPLTFLLMTLLSPLTHAFGLELATVDVALIVVLHIAMVDRRGGVFRPSPRIGLQLGLLDVGSVVTALALGYLVDLLGGGLKGLHGFGLAALFLVARLLARQIYMAGAVSQFLVTLVGSLGTSVLVLAMRWTLGVAPGPSMIVVVLAQAALTAAAAPPLMWALRTLDARLWPEPGERGGLHQLRK